MKRQAWYRMAVMITAVCLLIPAALAWAGGGTATEVEFALVEKSGVVVVNVSGTMMEQTAEGVVGNFCEGRFAFMLTTAETKNVLVARGENGEIDHVHAVWEAWHPLVKGVIVVHRAAGDQLIPVSTRGYTEFQGSENGGALVGTLRIRTYLGMGSKTDAGLGYLFITMRGFMAGSAAPEGPATVSVSSLVPGGKSANLSGRYGTGSMADVAELKGGLGTVVEKEALERYPITEKGGTVRAVLFGEIYESDPVTGESLSLPAKGEFTLAIEPSLRGEGVYYQWSDELGTGEGYDLHLRRIGVLHLTVTVTRPTGDEVFHVSAPGAFGAYYDANRMCGETAWSRTLNIQYVSPLHETGKPVDNFVRGSIVLSGAGGEGPCLCGCGFATITMSGFERSMTLSGTFEMAR